MKLLGYEIKRSGSKEVLKQATGGFNQTLLTDTSHILSHLAHFDIDYKFFGKNVQTALNYEVLDTGLRFIANCLTQVEFKTIDDKGNEVEHDILEVLKYPNDLQKRNDLLYQWAYYLQASGIVFQSIKDNSIVNPFDFQLINLNPDDIVVKKNKKSILEMSNEDLRIYLKEDLKDFSRGGILTTELNKELLIRYSNGVSIDNINTYSPFHSLKNEIKNIEVAKKAKHNKLKLSGAIIGTPKPSNSTNEMSQKMTDTVIDNSKEQITHKSLSEQRLRNSGLYGDDYVKLLTLPIQFNSLTKDLNSLDFESEVISDYRKIYRKIGIAEDLTGLDGKRATYENQVNSMINLYQTKIQNMADLFVSGINEKKMKDTGVKLIGDFSHLPIFTKVEKETQDCVASDMETYLQLLDRNLITEQDFKDRFKL